MRNIPITQIPNAPDALGLGPEIPGVGMPNMRGGGYSVPEIQGPDFGNAIRMMGNAADFMMATPPKTVNFVDYESRAWADFGETTRQVGNQLMDFAVNMQRVQDEGNLAKIENMTNAAYGEFGNWAMDKQPDEIVPEWQRRREKLLKEIDKVQFSQTAAAKRDVWMRSTMTRYDMETATMANKLRIKSAGDEMSAKYQHELNTGNYEAAAGTSAAMWKAGLSTEGGHEANMYAIKTKQHADARGIAFDSAEAYVHDYYTVPGSDLDGLETDLQQALKTGQSQYFPEFNNEDPAQSRGDFLKILQFNKGVRSNAEMDRYNNMLNDVLSGVYESPEEVREAAKEAGLPETRINNILSTFLDTPEEREKRLSIRPAILQQLKAYSPESDPDQTQFWEIEAQIKSLPEGYQSDLREQLFKKWREQTSPDPSTALSQIKSQATSMLKGDGYGAWEKDKESGLPVKGKEEAWIKANERYAAEMDALDKWAEANPKEAADSTKVYEQWNAIRTRFYEADRAAGKTPIRPAIIQMPRAQDVLRDVERMRLDGQDPRFRQPDQTSAPELPPGDGSWRVLPKTRDQIRSKSTAASRQVSLDFNDWQNPPADIDGNRRVEIVIPYNATTEERAAAQTYVNRMTQFFRDKGIPIQPGKVLSKTGNGELVSRFHTEPFYAKDSKAYEAVRDNPDDVAAILEDTLGRIPNVTFIAPHRQKDPGAVNDETNERDFALGYLIPALQRRKGRTDLAQQ